MIDALAIIEILDSLHGNPNFQRIFNITERLIMQEKKAKKLAKKNSKKKKDEIEHAQEPEILPEPELPPEPPTPQP